MPKDIDLNKLDQITLDFEEKFEEITGEEREFPKYTRLIINQANQTSQATRPHTVGKMSELINEPEERTYEDWKQWYMENHGEKLDEATEKCWNMIQNMQKAIQKIDKKMVREWIEELVIDNTAEGLIIQQTILQKLASIQDKEWKKATSKEESKNIDGYIGNQPISIKSVSYLSKDPTTRENIDIPIIFYEKTNSKLKIYYNKNKI